jgi:hypothetical protein
VAALRENDRTHQGVVSFPMLNAFITHDTPERSKSVEALWDRNVKKLDEK